MMMLRKDSIVALCCVLLGGCTRSTRSTVVLRDSGTVQRANSTSHAPAQKPETMSLLGRPLYAHPIGPDLTKLKDDLAAAEADQAAHPEDPAKIVWVGRRLGYLWRMNDAIDVFTKGIRKFPQYAPLYRHRGHRYISIRQFDQAIADLEKAAQLIRGQPDEIEADGMPNERGIPLTTTGFNVWYHLGVARYLKGEYEGALRSFQATMKYTRNLGDNVVAVSDWMYLTLRRLGRHDEAAAILGPIQPHMDIIENRAYHQRLLMYKGQIEPVEVLDVKSASGLEFATLGYGVGYWYLHAGQTETAMKVFRQVVESLYWPAFGYIAAEVELARERDRTEKLSFRARKNPRY